PCEICSLSLRDALPILQVTRESWPGSRTVGVCLTQSTTTPTCSTDLAWRTPTKLGRGIRSAMRVVDLSNSAEREAWSRAVSPPGDRKSTRLNSSHVKTS